MRCHSNSNTSDGVLESDPVMSFCPIIQCKIIRYLFYYNIYVKTLQTIIFSIFYFKLLNRFKYKAKYLLIYD